MMCSFIARRPMVLAGTSNRGLPSIAHSRQAQNPLGMVPFLYLQNPVRDAGFEPALDGF